jgi:hypothetical protein
MRKKVNHYRVNGKIFKSLSKITIKVIDDNGKLVGLARIVDLMDLLNGKRDFVDLVVFEDQPQTDPPKFSIKIADPEKLPVGDA